MKKVDRIAQLATELIKVFDRLDRDTMDKTPKRFAKMWVELLAGYNVSDKSVITCFNDSFDQLICMKNIEFVSVCEHHLLPFLGQVHIAYLPDKLVLGASKFGRIVDKVTKKLQIQERVTKEIADIFVKYVKPKGVLVICEAKHMCMMLRGVKKQNSVFVTSEARGLLREDFNLKQEALALIYERVSK